MSESRINPEIKPGMRVIITKRLGVASQEASALVPAGLEAIEKANKSGLDSWDWAGLDKGSKGKVETVYITGYSDVLFDPTKKNSKPFSFAVPTEVLSLS